MIPSSCLNILLVSNPCIGLGFSVLHVLALALCLAVCWWEESCLAHLSAPFSRLQVAPGFAFCCPGWRKAVPSRDHRILLALCWTPSCCFVFLLRAVSMCKSQTHFGWELTSAVRKGIITPLDCCLHCANGRVVVVFTCVLQPHTCFKLTEAQLPSPLFNYSSTSFPLLCWH